MWYTSVMTAAIPDRNRELDETSAILGLSQTELADLFGVRAPSLAEWKTRGIPPARRAAVERLHDLALVLNRKVIPSRIPQIVRTADEWLGGRTILEVIRAEGVEPIYTYLARLFSYGAS
jgi:transcriptional regulator with XRE-family HTH domain